MTARRAIRVSSTTLIPTRIALAIGLLTAAFGLTSAGCWLLPIVGLDPYGETGAAGLEKFESAEAFKRYLADQVRDEQSYYRGGDGFDALVGAPVAFSMPGSAVGQPAPTVANDGADAGSAGEASGDDYSQTNIQEAGVDESDLVKNDATYLYILDAGPSTYDWDFVVWPAPADDSGGTTAATGRLRIVQAVPADQMAIISTVDLTGTPDSLFLRGDQVIAICRTANGTAVVIFDVTDRAAPVRVATVDVAGSLVTSRLIGSKLHIVTETWPTLPGDGDETAIMAASYDELVPDLSVKRAGEPATSRDLVPWQAFYHPIDPDGHKVSAVVTIDLDDPAVPVYSVGVMADASTVYASTEALYLTDNEFDYGRNQRETTDIYKFAFGDEAATLVGVGTIPGRLLNRFSLGEKDGYLRTATTIRRSWADGADIPSQNGVYVLGQDGDKLAVMGKIEGIAPGERIYAARFVGDRGFLVTFRQVDPLYTLDLSNPTAPRVVGELKVPGYSDYIHPLGENHLLTIGKDAVDTGMNAGLYQGVQISVFDVTDFANPQQVDVELIGDRGTESEALSEPHAFNYFATAEMLVVPMTIAEGATPGSPWSYGEWAFSGFCMFDVTPEGGIEPVARVASASAGESLRTSWWGRGVFMGDHVFVVTRSEVQALPLADLNAEPVALPLE